MMQTLHFSVDLYGIAFQYYAIAFHYYKEIATIHFYRRYTSLYVYANVDHIAIT